MLNKPISIILLVIMILGISVVSSVNYKSSLAAPADTNVQPVAIVPINITNTQNAATPNPFQVIIDVNSSKYAAYEASDLRNVAFTYPNGTLIPSWLESGNNNSSTDTVYWLRVGSIPATSRMTINMIFYPTTDNVLNNETTGEAPALSPSYGQYDDGANVFVLYADFTRDLNGWLPYEYSGNFVPLQSVSGVEMLNAVGGEATYLVSPTELPPIPIEVEEGWNYNGNGVNHPKETISMFGSSPFGTTTNVISQNGAVALNNSVYATFDYDHVAPSSYLAQSMTGSVVSSGSFPGAGSYNVVSFLTVSGTSAFAGYAIQSVSIDNFGSALIPTVLSGQVPNPFANHALIISAYDGGSDFQYVMWVVATAFPPNGVAPSVTVGNVLAPTISILSPENITYNVTSVPLTFTVDQITSWMGYSLDGQSNITVSGNTTLIDLTDGVHNVIVFANNTANVMGVSNTAFFKIQTLTITNVSQIPVATNVNSTNAVSVNATVTDGVSTITQVSLNYTNGNGTWITANMTNLQGNVWNSIIPAFPYGTNVTYIVAATASTGNTVTTQQLGYNLQYTVVPEFTALPIVFLFLTATLLAVLIRTRKRPGTLMRAY